MELERPVPVVRADVNALMRLPAKARNVIYVAHGVLALAGTTALVGFGSIAHSVPPWLIVGNAVLLSLAVPVNSIASQNVTKGTDAA